MPLTKEELEAITEAVTSTIQRLARSKPVDEGDEMESSICITDRRHLTNFMNRLKALGNGNLEIGIETFGRVISTLDRRKRFSERVTGSVAVFIFVSITGGIVALLLWGVAAWIQATIKMAVIVPLP